MCALCEWPDLITLARNIVKSAQPHTAISSFCFRQDSVILRFAHYAAPHQLRRRERGYTYTHEVVNRLESEG